MCLVLVIISQHLDRAWSQLEQLRRPRSLPEASSMPPVPMTLIPEGMFVMGANGTDALEDERPQHEVWLDRFEMDRVEVTVGH